VAKAIVKSQPDLVVHTGDMVRYGRSDWQWDKELFAPAAGLFASIPFYAVLGNHDVRAPLFGEMFYAPGPTGKAFNWHQNANGVELIGIEGWEDWAHGSPNARWLEGILSATKARFIFLFSHYGAYSSGKRGRLDEATGKPREKAARQGREVLVPLLGKYGATAMFVGHDHFYERSELPGGLTHVITAAAGASQRGKVLWAGKQNPYSKAFASTLHYCLVDVTGDTATMTVLTPAGKVLDKRTWKARAMGAEHDAERLAPSRAIGIRRCWVCRHRVETPRRSG